MRFVRSDQFGDPAALVAEYVRRAADGQFVSLWRSAQNHPGPEWTAWRESAVTCAGRLPLYSAPVRSVAVAPTIIIASYALGEVRMRHDSAVVEVQYRELERLAPGGVFVAAARLRKSAFVVRRTPWGWRIDNPGPDERVLARAALARIHLSTPVQQQLIEASQSAR